MTQARYSSPSNPLNHSDPLTLASKPSVFCKLAAQLRELSLGSLELVHLALDEAGSEMGAVGDAFRGEDVHIAKFVLRGLEIGELYMALVSTSALTQKLMAPRLTPSSSAISRCEASGWLSSRRRTLKFTSSRNRVILSLTMGWVDTACGKATARRVNLHLPRPRQTTR